MVIPTLNLLHFYRNGFALSLTLGLTLAVVAGNVISETDTKPWLNKTSAPEIRSQQLLSVMTKAQKFQQLVGAAGQVPELPECYGARHVPGLPELAIPTLRITNGPVGVGQNDCVPAEHANPDNALSFLTTPHSAKATQLPSAMAIAASFDRKVAGQFGTILGVESNNLALHVMEGPGMNLARNPTLGRNFEYFGEDPYLSGTLAVAEIKAIQAEGVIAMAKHLVANDQETNRMTLNEIIDDKVLHELYLLPFEMSAKEGEVAAMMCSYNTVNGEGMCSNKHILTDILRGQWGFDGYVQSDFYAVHDVATTMKAGMDHEMPGMDFPQFGAITHWKPEALQAALDAGELSMSDIDTALHRRYKQMFKFGIFDRPVVQVPIDAESNGNIARSMGEQSAVLLKNDNELLPFSSSVNNIVIIGKSTYADTAVAGCCGGSSDVIPLYTVKPLQGLKNTLTAIGSSAKVTLVVVNEDNSNLDEAVAAARLADAVVIMAGTLAEEGNDRAGISLDSGDQVGTALQAMSAGSKLINRNQIEMITMVTAANPTKTALVLKDNASSLLPFIDQIPAVLEVWFPGQEDGNIVANLLMGVVNPSGKLPVTFPMREGEWPANTPMQYPGVMVNGRPTVTYSEGLNIGYRWYDAENIAPRFPFGFGLSYTRFALTNLTVSPLVSNGHQPVSVSLDVENTGKVAGAEVPQIYVSMPAILNQPPKRLINFKKVFLNPGEKKTVTMSIDPLSASHPLGTWNVATQQWLTATGNYQLLVGNSSGALDLSDTITISD
ncbi:MAG: glycoside hydrolase family 3 C-terminal domain-containing protein [Oceanicoccus sp.]